MQLVKCKDTIHYLLYIYEKSMRKVFRVHDVDEL